MSRRRNTQRILPAWIVAAFFLGFFIFSTGIFAETTFEPHPVEAAKAAIKAKNDDEALKLLSAFVRSNATAPESAEARFLLGQIQARQKQLDEAFRSFAAVISSARGTEWAAKALAETAKLHETRRNRTGAQQARESLLRDYPESPTTAHVWSSAAERHFHAGEFREANAIFSKIASQLQGSARRQAEAAAILADTAGDLRRIVEIADTAIDQDRMALARTLLQVVIDRKPPVPLLDEARVKNAWCLYMEGGEENYLSVERTWREIAQRDSTGEWGGRSRWHLVQLHAGPRSDWRTAAEMCAAIARDFPADSFRHEQALFTRAWLLVVHKDWVNAASALEELLQYYPSKKDHPTIVRFSESIQAGLGASEPASVSP